MDDMLVKRCLKQFFLRVDFHSRTIKDLKAQTISMTVGRRLAPTLQVPSPHLAIHFALLHSIEYNVYYACKP